jgi:hypothetical protein
MLGRKRAHDTMLQACRRLSQEALDSAVNPPIYRSQ